MEFVFFSEICDSLGFTFLQPLETPTRIGAFSFVTAPMGVAPWGSHRSGSGETAERPLTNTQVL